MKIIYDEFKRISEIQATPEESPIVESFLKNYFDAISTHETELTKRNQQMVDLNKYYADQFIGGSLQGGMPNDF